MHLRALLVCEDVRLEVDGTLTLIGVYNDRLPVRRTSTDGPLRLEHLTFVLVVGGLTGVDSIGVHQHHGLVDAAAPEPVLAFHVHEPTTDEHNFAFGHAPLELPGFGSYEVAITVEARGEQVVFRHRFRVEPSRFS